MWQPTRLEEERLEKARRLEERGVDLYPRRAQRTHTTTAAIAAFEANETAEPPAAVTVTGRIRRANVKGNVAFMHIEDESGRVQLFFRVNDMQEAEYALIKERLVDVDDFVQASGTMMRTKAGEVSVAVKTFTLLAKSLTPLPVVKQEVLEDGTTIEHGEFTDKETRYRQRYADLAVNGATRDVFIKRAKTIKAMRNFLDQEGMLEVETPILQPLYGGAAARPFTTFHNELKEELYLRISFELYLKRLLVGGYDAVYEIGRDFRNEGVSIKHNPEFTMMEFYKAYIDYNGVMDIVERMTAYIAQQVNGTTQVTFRGNTFDVTPLWRRATVRELIKEKLDIDYMDYADVESLVDMIKTRFNRTVKPGTPWGKIVMDELFGEHVESTLIEPTFVLDYPRDISPFAKRADWDDRHVERFEIYAGGMELGNAFTELNDPRDQAQRFAEMAANFKEGDEDETPLDEDYLRAMRYGMPPCGGYGMGIDRLVMLLTDQTSIRDVLLYPHMRREVKA
jgi:lysyl-tRNA synthetase class 2